MKRTLIVLLFLCVTSSGATLEEMDTEIASHSDYKMLSRDNWETKILYRQAQRLFPEDLQRAIDGYVEKITRGREVMANNPTKEDKEYWVIALPRLLDKLACCRKEQALRKDGVVRSMHHTAYYIDYINGLDTNTGLSIAQSWKTITKYTTTTIRTAGDIAYLRANITWTQGTEAVDIILDESGTVDDYIKIIGCDATTNDPWEDANDVKPIVDFQDAAYQVYINNDSFWWFERLDIRQSTDAYGMVRCYVGDRQRFVDCDFSDTTVPGLRSDGSDIEMDGCTFNDLHSSVGQIYLSNSSFGGDLIATDCTFNHGPGVGSDYTLSNRGGRALFTNCSFGDTTQFDNAIFQLFTGSHISLRNCTYTGTLTSYSPGSSYNAYLYSEDHDGIFESHYMECYQGSITRATASPRSAGADSYATMTPTAFCGPNALLQLGNAMSGFARYWATASQQINISVYARVGSAWDSALAANEAYARFNYLSNGASAARTEVQSTQTIANDTAWTAFTSGNITPLQTGWVYIWFNLAEYEDATEYVDVDILPVVN